MATQNLDILKQYGKIKEDLLPEPNSPFVRQIANFSTQMVARMKQNLIDAGKYNTGGLVQSISFEDIKFEEDGSVVVSFIGDDYAKFVDQGVNAVGQQNHRSTYSFHSSPDRPTSEPYKWTEGIKRWLRDRGIRTLTWRDRETGEIKTKQLKDDKDYKAAAFVIIKGLKKHGIAPTNFVDDAFSEAEIQEFGNTLKSLWR